MLQDTRCKLQILSGTLQSALSSRRNDTLHVYLEIYQMRRIQFININASFKNLIIHN